MSTRTRKGSTAARGERPGRAAWVVGAACLALGWLAGPLAAQPPETPGELPPPAREVPQAVPQPAGQPLLQPVAPPQQLTVPPREETLPAPRPIPPFGPGQTRLPLLDCPAPLGTTPHPGPATRLEYGRFIKEMKDPESTLDLLLGRTRLLVLAQAPSRIQFADPSIASGAMLSPLQLSLVGKNVGSTVLTLWFVDPRDSVEHVLTYMVRVLPDPEAKERLERVYKALQDEINHAFPDSLVALCLVGDKVVVSGQAKDIAECTQILRIIRANLPPIPAAQIPVDRLKTDPHADALGPDGLPPHGIEDYMSAGGPNVINLLKVPGEQQVMLRVTVAEVNRAAARSIGLNFSINSDHGNTVAAQLSGNIASGGLSSFTNGFNFLSPVGKSGEALETGTGFSNLPVSLDNGQVRLAIDALRTLNYARSLAEPNLVTLNGQTATFQAGGRFPIPVVTGNTVSGLQGVQFMPFGVQLTFTPFITDRDRIRLQVSADVSSRDTEAGSTNIGGAAIPNLITRNFQTVVELREGQTLAVAGLIQNTLGGDSERVPLFGDLPVVGALFGFNRVSAGEQELVVLITPELVHPLEHKEVPPLPGSDLFEPSDVEFYLLDRIESHRPVDYRSSVRTDWERMKEYRRCEQLYLSGAPGFAPPPPQP